MIFSDPDGKHMGDKKSATKLNKESFRFRSVGHGYVTLKLRDS